MRIEITDKNIIRLLEANTKNTDKIVLEILQDFYNNYEKRKSNIYSINENDKDENFWNTF